jgi:hypothetical protein
MRRVAVVMAANIITASIHNTSIRIHIGASRATLIMDIPRTQGTTRLAVPTTPIAQRDQPMVDSRSDVSFDDDFGHAVRINALLSQVCGITHQRTRPNNDMPCER